MSNENKPTILSNSESVSQSNAIIFDEKRRLELIQVLRQVPSILDVAKKLMEGKTYKAYISPEVLEQIKSGSARLANRDNGLLGANILDVETGKIIHNASLIEVTPDFLGSLNQLAMQQTLANIVNRLEVLDGKITDVLRGQLNDRLAEVKSGIHMYEQAIVASDPNVKRELVIAAIQKLNDGRNKLIKSTDFSFLQELPKDWFSMFLSSIWDIPEYVESKARPIYMASHDIVEASSYLVQAYSVLNEPNSLRVSLEQARSEIEYFQENIKEIVRWLPPTSNWREIFISISKGVLPSARDLDNISRKAIILEFQPQEITSHKGD